jgi:histidyl-tRNA synthetase
MASISTDPASGTRDFLPEDVSHREDVFGKIRTVFERHGFAPLDTPAFERLDVLTGKYGDEGDQLMFKILRRGEHEGTGEADLALRYDLTVPLARVVARYGSQLVMPFKRYHIAPVWRADRPGKGRFREFFQCDVDTIGSDSLMADATTIAAVTDALAETGLSGFTVRLNSRKALRGLVEAYGVPVDLEADALVAIDKLDKIGVDGVAAELTDRGVPEAAVRTLSEDLGHTQMVDAFRERLAATERGREGLAEVDEVLSLLDGTVAGGRVQYAPVLARGLSYYTGPVFEVVHDGMQASIAGGGRYDGLVGMFSGQDVAACGGSLGLERILMLVAEQGHADRGPQVLVTLMDDDAGADALQLAARVRAAGVRTDVWSGTGRLGKQLKYADRRGIRFALIRGSDERADGTVAVKNLATGDQTAVPLDDVAVHLAEQLDPGGSA